MRIWIILCHINIWTLLVINGYEYCITDKPVIDVCTISTVNNKDNVMRGVNVNTGNSPKITANVCRCTIMPDTMKTISLHITGDSILPTVEDKFMIKINNVTLNDLQGVPSVEINGETEFLYSSSIDFTGGFCLSIAPKSSNGTFSMTCAANQNVTTTEGTTSSNGNSTDTMTEPTVSNTQTKPSNDANHDSETNITLIAIISGSVGGVAFIALVIISILCCKRKRKPEITEATASNEPENNDDNAYGMVTNPSYEHFSEVLPMETLASEDHNKNVDFTNVDSSSHYYSTPVKTDNNKLHIQKIQQDEDDTYDHTVTSTSGNWTGNEYKRQPINRNGNNSDNENYSVLNPK